jgi:hypothetical protein
VPYVTNDEHITPPQDKGDTAASGSGNGSGTSEEGHALLHVLAREADGTFSFTTVNSGAPEHGLAYHPTCVQQDTLATVKVLALHQAGIEPIKLQDR